MSHFAELVPTYSLHWLPLRGRPSSSMDWYSRMAVFKSYGYWAQLVVAMIGLHAAGCIVFECVKICARRPLQASQRHAALDPQGPAI